MRSVLLRSVVIVGHFLVSGCVLNLVRADEPTDNLRAKLGELHQWLDSGGQAQQWREYLKSEQLEAELAGGAKPDRVAGILSKYTADQPGLKKSRFVAVRTALSAWLNELESSDTVDLAQAALDAKDQFRPLDENLVRNAKQSLSRDMRILERDLQTSGRKNANAWKVYLRWSELEEQLSAPDGPKINLLDAVYRSRFRGNEAGLERPQVMAVRESLLNYMRAEFFGNIPKLEEEYHKQLDKLADGLTRFEAEPAERTADEIAFILGWLKNTGQAESLVRSIQHRYSRPNVSGYVSRFLLAAGVDREQRDTRPVNEYAGGTRVRGTATIASTISSRTVSHPSRAAFDILLKGTVNARVRGSQGPVTVCSGSKTQVNAIKRIFIDEYGFNARPANARAATHAYITGISAPPIIRHFAQGPARKAVNQSEGRTSRQVEDQVEQQLDDEAGGALADANTQYGDFIRHPLLRRRAFPQWFAFNGSTDGLHINARQANDFQLAAWGEQPPLPPSHAIAVNLHQSAISNIAAAAAAGERFTHTDIAGLLEGVTDEIPEELQASEDAEAWSITFDASRPLSVQFTEGTIKVTIRGRRFENGDQAINRRMAMSAVYAIERSGDSVMLRRQGDAVAEYISQDDENLVERAVKSKMKARFTALFTEEIDISGIELPDPWSKVGKLWMSHITSDGGWLTLGLNLPQ